MYWVEVAIGTILILLAGVVGFMGLDLFARWWVGKYG